MYQEIILAVIALISGGGLSAGIKIFLDHIKHKKALRGDEIDDRVMAWQKISQKNEERIERLEIKLELYERDFRSLERYILSLEQTIVRAVPPLELPDRPILEREFRFGD